MGQTKTAHIEGSTPAGASTDREKSESVITSGARRTKSGRGKNYKLSRTKVDGNKLYSVQQAVDLVKETSYTRFDATVELHLVVNKEGFSTQVDLPNSTGKSKKIEIADDKTVAKLKEGKVDFDLLLAMPDMMPKLVPFARILGPKGLMPNPKNGTIIKSAKDAEKFSGNSMTVKTERSAPLIHTIVGKVSMDGSKLVQNIDALLDAVGRRKIRKAYLSATMSPSVKIDLS